MNRRKQLYILILLSSVILMTPYAIQGALAVGETPANLARWLYAVDQTLWAFRALIEGLVVVYLFSTEATSRGQAWALGFFKVVLIVLIALTLGPTLDATNVGLPLRDTVASGWRRAWSFGLAAYAPLMIGAAAYAYRVQPHDDGAQPMDAGVQVELSRLQTMESQWLDEQERLRGQLATLQNEVSGLRAQLSTVPAWDVLSATAKATWIAEHCNGEKPAATELATALGVGVSTVSKGYKKANQ